MAKKDFNLLMDLEANKGKAPKIFDSLSDQEEKEVGKKFSLRLLLDFICSRVRNNFFAGFGVGLIVAAIVLWTFGGEVMEADPSSLDVKYTDTKVIEKAKELGMLFPYEISTSHVEQQIIDNEIYDVEDVNND